MSGGYGAASAASSWGSKVQDGKRRIRLVSLTRGGEHPAAGKWIVSYDPEAHLPDGSYEGGVLITTDDPAKATLFAPEAAYAVWMAGPRCACHRLRPDGKPNRPLTAFNVEIQ